MKSSGQTPSRRDGQWVDDVEDTLTDAIRLRLRADVPVALTLSGGIDSSLIDILARKRLGAELGVFSFSHGDSPSSEAASVQRLTSSFGDSVNWISSPAKETVQEAVDALGIAEFPIWSLAGTAYRATYEAIHRAGFKVVVEGHGSDEQLGGYPYMIEARVNELFRKHRFVSAFRVALAQHKLTNPNLGHRESLWRLVTRLALGRSGVAESLETAIWDAFEYRVLPIVLRAFDRFPMHAGIESRSPYLDYRLVEMFSSMPSHLKVGPEGSKVVLRRILDRHGYSWVHRAKPKMGFSSDVPAFYTPENLASAKEIVRDYVARNTDRYDGQITENWEPENATFSGYFQFSKLLQLAILERMYSFEDSRAGMASRA